MKDIYILNSHLLTALNMRRRTYIKTVGALGNLISPNEEYTLAANFIRSIYKKM
jgi:hypothetical protein